MYNMKLLDLTDYFGGCSLGRFDKVVVNYVLNYKGESIHINKVGFHTKKGQISMKTMSESSFLSV